MKPPRIEIRARSYGGRIATLIICTRKTLRTRHAHKTTSEGGHTLLASLLLKYACEGVVRMTKEKNVGCEKKTWNTRLEDRDLGSQAHQDYQPTSACSKSSGETKEKEKKERRGRRVRYISNMKDT